MLGFAYYSLGQIEQAIDYHEQSLAIARETGDRRGEGIRLSGLGLAYHALGQIKQAIKFHEQARFTTYERERQRLRFS
jgi:tetratricopeptide (TPR) repeat protein